MPQYNDIDWRGLDFSKEQFDQLMSTDRGEWVQELASHDDLFFKLYDRLPKELTFIRELLISGFLTRQSTGYEKRLGRRPA